MLSTCRLPVLLLLATCLWVAVAHADAVTDLAGLVSRGRYDEALVTSSGLGGTHAGDQRVSYLRGLSAYRIGWFEMALDCLQPLGDFAPWAGWEPAPVYSHRANQLLRMSPQQLAEVKSGEVSVFRVHFDTHCGWAQSLISLLPTAYERVRDSLGLPVAATAVFIFADDAAFSEFYQVWTGYRPTSWQWATGGGGALLFSEGAAKRVGCHDVTSPYVQGSVAHELSHCVLWRYLGTSYPPPWLDEGLAMMCGALLSPGDNASNDTWASTARASGAVLDMATLSSRDLFFAVPDTRRAYEQGFALTRYLRGRVGREGIGRLLSLFRDAPDFDAALRQVAGVDQEGLLQAWRAAEEG